MSKTHKQKFREIMEVFNKEIGELDQFQKQCTAILTHKKSSLLNVNSYDAISKTVHEVGIMINALNNSRQQIEKIIKSE